MRATAAAVFGALFVTACADEPRAQAPVGVGQQPLTRGKLSANRTQSTLTALPDGTFLFAGGVGPDPATAMALSSADVYDPERGAVVWSGTMLHPHASHTATLLDDGRVLIAGGGVPYAEFFDPATRTFSAAPTMNDSRTGHSATRLPDGTVLVVGGGATSGTGCQIFKPAQNTWGAAPPTNVARAFHTAVLDNLVDPQVVVVVGGTGTGSSGDDFRTTEVYEPIAGNWTKKAKLPTNATTGGNGSNAMLLLDGGLLVTGLSTGTLFDGNRLDMTDYLFNGTSWATAGFCDNGEIGHPGLMMPDGVPYTFGYYGGGSGCGNITTQDTQRIIRSHVTTVQTLANMSCSVPAGAPMLETVRRDPNLAVMPNGSVVMAGGLEFYACGYNIRDTLTVIRMSGLRTADAGVLASAGRLDAVGTSLWNGGVLVSGGTDGTAALASAEVFSVAAGSSVATLPLSSARSQHTATVLRDGRVLVAGGVDDAGTPLATADLLNPADGGASLGLALKHARAAHTATLLGDGRVLLVGGVTDGGTAGTSELFDPSTLSSVDTGALVQRRSHHAGVLMADGTVVVAGGQIGSSVLRSAERYSPDSGTWAALADLATSRTDPTATEVAGQALIIGGSGTASGARMPLATTEWWSPDAGVWSAGPSLATARYGHSATVLPSGLVVVAAGYNGASPLSSTEVLDPQTSVFTAGPLLSGPRGRHAGVAANDGVVLLGGELDPTRVERLADTQVVLPRLVPTLLPVATGASAGGTLPLSGTGLVGYGDNGGATFRASATNLPVFFVTRSDGEGRRFLRTTAWTATTATVALPADLVPGAYWLRASVGGATSAPVQLQVGALDGQSCSTGGACVGGFCVNGVCCRTATCSTITDGGTAGGAGGGSGGGTAGGSGGGPAGGQGGGDAGGAGGSGGGEAGGAGGGSTGGGTAGGDSADGGTSDGRPDLFSCGCSAGAPGSLLYGALLLVVLRRRSSRARQAVPVALALLLAWPTVARAEAPPRQRVAVLALKALGGVKADIAQVVTSQLSSAVQGRGYVVMSNEDIEAKLGLDRQRQLMGCTDASCLAEIGDALGVDKLVSGNIAQVGGSVVINLALINNKSGAVEYRYSERVKNANDEAFLDLVPLAVNALFPESTAVARSGGSSAEVTQTGDADGSSPRHRFGIDVRGQLATYELGTHLHGALAVVATFRVIPNLELGVGGLVSRTPGGLVRVGWIPFAADSKVHPLVALEVPVLVASGTAAVGVSGALGVEFLPVPMFAIRAEVPVTYFFTPASQTNLLVFGALSVGVRL